jgi:hypothetical protein
MRDDCNLLISPRLGHVYQSMFDGSNPEPNRSSAPMRFDGSNIPLTPCAIGSYPLPSPWGVPPTQGPPPPPHVCHSTYKSSEMVDRRGVIVGP